MTHRTLVWLLAVYLFSFSAWAGAQEPAIRFGLQVAQQQTTVAELKEVWQEAEALGFDTLWVNDHVLPSVGPANEACLEGWTVLAAMATATSRVRIGCLVTSNTFRHPAVLAKMATTIDHLSQSRLIFGIGAGWFKREHEAYGIPFPSLRERAQRLEESLQIIQQLWTGSQVSFQGQYYTLIDAPFFPKPRQQPHPPIMIGGVGEKLILPLVARYAQMWNIPSLTPEEIAAKSQVLEQYCQEMGRNCAEIERSYLTPLYLKADPAEVEPLVERVARLRGISVERVRRSILVGDPAAIRQQMQAYLDVGVTHFIINLRRPGLYDREGVRIFAREVMPAFRQQAATAD
jgi:F420-dependent oxidoreductase-like protein